MTVADRIDQISVRRWVAPVLIVDDETYIGKHRRPGRVWLSPTRLFYLARHASR